MFLNHPMIDSPIAMGQGELLSQLLALVLVELIRAWWVDKEIITGSKLAILLAIFFAWLIVLPSGPAV